MAKKQVEKPFNGQSVDLPAMLVQAMEGASKLIVPYPTEEEQIRIPNLFAFLTPMVLPDPKYKGEGKPPKKLREPMVLLSWDRRLGAWKASLSDKTLNLGGSWPCQSLLTALLDTERALADSLFPWSEKKIT